MLEVYFWWRFIIRRGYVDFKRLYIIHQQKAFFVTRAKDNTQLKRVYSSKVDKTIGILCDQKVKLTGIKTLLSDKKIKG